MFCLPERAWLILPSAIQIISNLQLPFAFGFELQNFEAAIGTGDF